MKKSVLRLITLFVTVALLCGATLCFSLSSSAENLLTDSWTALDESQSALVSFAGGVLTLDASGGTDVKAYQDVALPAGSYRFSADKSVDAASLAVVTAAGEVPEGKYDEAGHVDFTIAAQETVRVRADMYRGNTGTLSNLMLASTGSTPSSTTENQGSSDASSTESSATESSATESSATESSATESSATSATQQGGSSELTDNWQAEDPAQASLVSFAGGVLTLDATGGTDVKAAQKVSLPAGSYRFAATKSGTPEPDLMVRTSAGDIAEGKYEEAGHVDFTLNAPEEVTLKVSEYRGGVGTLSNITLTNTGSTPSGSDPTGSNPTGSDPSQTETQPSSAPATGNLIKNGAFNNGMDGWERMNLDENTAKVMDGALVINMANAWHASVTPTINGTIKPNTQYTLKYEATGVNNLQVRIHKADGDGGGASQIAAPGETTFTTDGLTASANFYVVIEIIADGDVAGTFDNFVLVEGTNTDVTEPSSDPSQSGTTPSQSGTTPSQTPGQTGKYVVWSGTIGRDFTTKNTVAVIGVDELTQAFRNDLTANGVPQKYEIEAVASYTSGPSGYVSWGFYQESPYMELWSDKGSTPTSATISGDAKAPLSSLNSSASVCLFSEATGDIAHVDSLTLYAYREGSTPSQSATNPSGSSIDPSQTQPSSTPGQVGKVVVWSGTINRDFTSKSNGFAAINEDALTQAFRDDIAANGVPQKYEIEATANYVSGPSGYACYGFYQDEPYLEFWADKGGTLTNSTLSDASMLSQLNATAGLWLFSEGGNDVTHIDSLTLYAYREGATPSQSATDPTSASATDPTSASATDPTSASATDPTSASGTSSTIPSQPVDENLVWAGRLDADYTTVNGIAVINNQEMMMAVLGKLMTSGVPEKVRIKSEFNYLGGDSGYAAIGLYSNGQVIWPDAGYTDLSDVTFSNLSGLGTDTALVVFSGGSDTLHIGALEIYAYYGQPSETSATGTVVKGDATGDGKVDMKDVLALRKLLAGLVSADSINQANADATGDGNIDMKDVLKLRKVLAGLDTLD